MQQVTSFQILIRLRRNRKKESIRSLVRETHLLAKDLVYPFFLIEGIKKQEIIPTLPGISRLSIDLILKKAEALHKRGIQGIALFPYIPRDLKCPLGKEALNEQSFLIQAIQSIK